MQLSRCVGVVGWCWRGGSGHTECGDTDSGQARPSLDWQTQPEQATATNRQLTDDNNTTPDQQ